MAFSVVSGQNAVNTAASSNTISAALPSNPTTGNVVCVSFFFFDGTTSPVTATVTDGNGNAYTVAPTSPSTFLTDTGGSFCAYLIAGATANKTITVSFTRSGSAAVYTFANLHITEFHSSSGTISLDSSNVGTGSGATISTPTISVTGSGPDLLYCGIGVATNETAVNSPWTITPEGPDSDGCVAAYVLGATSSTALNISTAGGDYVSSAMSFKAGSNTTTTKTQAGKARITVHTAKTQAGKARITVHTPKTQAGKARVTIHTAQTQAGESRITARTTQTQAGKAKISGNTSTTKTQSGLARITVHSPQTQSGKARITIHTDQTQVGKANLLHETSQTQPGKARITARTTKTQSGKARITVHTSETQSGKSRISIHTSQTQSGKSRITVHTPQTQNGKSRITAHTQQTQSGKANIATNIARVNKVAAGTQSIGAALTTSGLNVTAGNLLVAYARWAGDATTATVTDSAGNTWVGISQVAWASGVGFANIFYCANCLGGSSVTFTLNTGSASFRGLEVAQYSGISTTSPLDAHDGTATGSTTTMTSGTFTITAPNELVFVGFGITNLTGGESAGTGYTLQDVNSTAGVGFEDKIVSSIQTSVTATATEGAANPWQMYVATFRAPNTTTQKTQSGKARITVHTAKTQVGKAAIRKTTTQTQSGKANVLVATITSKAQTGKARITARTQRTQIGKGAVRKTSTQTQGGKARIAHQTNQTQIGKAKIAGVTVRTQVGKANIRATTKRTQIGKAKVVLPSYKWILTSLVETSTNFANRVTILGAFAGTDAAEFTSTANDTASQTALGRVIAAIVPNRQLTTQAACDLAASIELGNRATQTRLTFDFFKDGLEVGDLVNIQSTNAAISGNFVIQQLTYNQISPTVTRYTAQVGNYQGSLQTRIRELARLTNPPYVTPVPPPANSVDNSMLQADAVDTLNIAAGAVTTALLAVDAVTSSIIAAGAVDTTQIADNAISTPKLQAGSIVAAKIASGAITAGAIAAGAVTSGTIAAGSIAAANAVFANGAIQTADIGSATITAAKIASATITNAQIASGTITGTNIASGTITGSNISGGTITGSNIASGTITGSNIQGGTITGTQISGATITGSNIASSTITDANISSLSASKITAGTISASISMTSPSLIITSGSVTLNVDATNIVKISDTSNHVTCQLTSTALTIASTSNSHQGGITSTALTFLNASGQDAVVLSGASGAGSLLLYSSGSPVTSLDTQLTVNNVSCINSSGTFVGAGVNTGSTGIAGGGFNPFISGVQYFGATGSFTAGSNTVTVKGGVIVSIV